MHLTILFLLQNYSYIERSPGVAPRTPAGRSIRAPSPRLAHTASLLAPSLVVLSIASFAGGSAHPCLSSLLRTSVAPSVPSPPSPLLVDLSGQIPHCRLLSLANTSHTFSFNRPLRPSPP
ncbi:hypothetical protein Syun_023022 [Stephania yunnanensis]|uniref:Uncharacterized protein n=1 Tax=Stephania yunnanensis TaxID=152371 RepID=A0AAP0I349_9MAGN